MQTATQEQHDHHHRDTSAMLPSTSWWLFSLLFALLLLSPGGSWNTIAAPAESTSKTPTVEIKPHSTGKEATVRLGAREWFIHVDVDQDRTMIIRTESDNGQEKSNQSEIVDRPMSPTEVDNLIHDFVSGISSTLKP